ncbi:MAG TPA: hypothetical protein VK487_05515 [Candidatus Bathyarchaeia archaeon]|nr:hypothetical protein [Candidatus Bathyarchaeia archaeon]
MFRVNSSGASGDRRHASFRTDASENSTILDDLNKNVGNIQAHHKYVV